MDRNGMYPPHNCKQCGNPLNADGFHPAELYAGTYTGLCYTCERKGSYVAEVYYDGAKRWNHPPHSPSWRRDRETSIGYDDCDNPKCKQGREYVSRSCTLGGSYYTQCDTCYARYHNEPRRAAYNATLKRYHEMIFSVVSRAFCKEAAGIAKARTGNRVNFKMSPIGNVKFPGTLPEAVTEDINIVLLYWAERFIDAYDLAKDLLAAQYPEVVAEFRQR